MSASSSWYHHWPVALIIAIPAFGITASLIAVSQAVSQPPQMVHGEYHKLGKALVDDWEPERRASAVQLRGRFAMDEGHATLELQYGQAAPVPETLWLIIAHPAQANLDQRIALQRQTGARYRSEQALTVPPRAHLQLTDEQGRWRLHGRIETNIPTTRLTPGISDG